MPHARASVERSEAGLVLSIPLPRRGGFGTAVVARVDQLTRRGPRSVLLYGFGPRQSAIPKAIDSLVLRPEGSALIELASDLHVRVGKWTVIGQVSPFSFQTWPMPAFKNWDRHRKRFRKALYDERTLGMIPGSWIDISDEEAANLPWEGFSASGAFEYGLDDAIEAQDKGAPYVPAGESYIRPPSARVLPRRR